MFSDFILDEHLEAEAVTAFLHNPSPHFEWVEYLVAWKHSRVDGTSASSIPASLRQRLVSVGVREVGVQNLLLSVLCHIFRSSKLHDATRLVRMLMKRHEPSERIETLIYYPDLTPTDGDLQHLQSWLVLIPNVTKKIETVQQTIREQLIRLLSLYGLPLCGYTKQSVFTKFDGAGPTSAVIEKFQQAFYAQWPCFLPAADCVLTVSQVRDVAPTGPRHDEEISSQYKMFLHWTQLVNAAPNHVNLSPLSNNAFVAPTTKVFLIGFDGDDQILKVVERSQFVRVLWIHPRPESVEGVTANMTIWSPREWATSGCCVDTELLILSQLNARELGSNVRTVLDTATCCCLIANVVLTPELARFTTPGSIYPLFPNAGRHKFVFFHEERSSFEDAIIQATQDALSVDNFAKRHCVIISHEKLQPRCRVSQWAPNREPERKTIERAQHVMIDLDLSMMLDPMQQFASVFATVLDSVPLDAEIHIIWNCDLMRHLILTIGALQKWTPVYFSRHTFFAAEHVPSASTAEQVQTHKCVPRRRKGKRKLKYPDTSNTREAGLTATAADLFSSRDFGLISTITILKRILLLTETTEEEFLVADYKRDHVIGSCDQTTLSSLVTQLEAHNLDMRSAHGNRPVGPTALLRRSAEMFRRGYKQHKKKLQYRFCRMRQ